METNSGVNQQFDQFALVELMGRQRIAGRVTETVIAGTGFLEVHVPETTHSPKFTRFISPSALYAINPIDEATCQVYAENLKIKPIDSWDISAFMKKVEEQRLLSSAGTGSTTEYEDEEEEEEEENEFES
jgi:hypothetical protein